MVRQWSNAGYIPREYQPLKKMYEAKGYVDVSLAMYRMQYLAMEVLQLDKKEQKKIIHHADKHGWGSALNVLEDRVIANLKAKN